MMKLLAISTFAASAAVAETATLGMTSQDRILDLGLPKNAETEAAFQKVYDQYLKDFDVDTFQQLMADLEVGLKSYEHSHAATAYKTTPAQPQCERGVVTPRMMSAMNTKAVAPFPGGMLKRLFGFDLGKLLFELSQKAAGPAAASGGMVPILATQALGMGASMIQSVVSAAVMIIPPMITGKPLSCVPMITGHNCFGAVLYPITMSDFVIADVTDSMMDGYLAGFPATYQQKVGKTSDAAYKLCGSAYMSMQCSSIFPKCNSPAASQDTPAPVMGRTPMCFHMCISTLVFCPGFWIDDILGPCQMVAPPPMCSMAIWFNFWRLPPQYVSYEDANPAPLECPKTDVTFNAESSYDLYDTNSDSNALGASPYLSAAGEGAASTGVSKFPNA